MIDADDLEKTVAALPGPEIVFDRDQVNAIIASIRRGAEAERKLASMGVPAR